MAHLSRCRESHRQWSADCGIGSVMSRRKRGKTNPNRVKLHRAYTIHEAARCLNVDRATVRRWLKAGLACCDDHRPFLIRGQDLREFLTKRKASRRHPCLLGQIYCVACRSSVFPLGNMADYVPETETTGDLVGLCPLCERLIHQRINVGRLIKIQCALEVAIPKTQPRIGETRILFVDAHLQSEGEKQSRLRNSRAESGACDQDRRSR